MTPESLNVQVDLAPNLSVTLETGCLAKQADGAVVVRVGDTMVLCTAVVSSRVRAGMSYFPLVVDYREKFASGGKIPGGFFKKEGRSNDKEILTSRLVDRAIRPLFPSGFRNDVQIIGSVVSADGENDGDMLVGNGASAALLLAGAPFDGPIAEVRVGRINGEFIINPSISALEGSDFNLVVAGKLDSLMMVEGQMDEVSEEHIVDALELAHAAIRKICQAQLDLLEAWQAQQGPAEPKAYMLEMPADELIARVDGLIGQRVAEHIRAPYEKMAFYGGLRNLEAEAVTELTGEDVDENDVRTAAGIVSKRIMREMVLADQRRIDGRRPDEVRPIWCSAGYLPRVHGSAVFTRGETQVLASATLGTNRDQQLIDQVFVHEDKRFFLHYEFPPYCTGEVKMLRGPSRREVGHGMLAERALVPMIPTEEEFPYTIRINADVLESNGSSSMASVCAGSLALMDAGVPLKKAVAGVAMGMISDGTRHVVLTDILGTEDHLGDMDFKVTGTREGITACQMDIKISGLSRSLMLEALYQAREARHHILDHMDAELSAARDGMSPYAPRLTVIQIDVEQIGAVIGPGGKVIRGIQAETGCSIDVDERDGFGFVTIAATDKTQADQAIEIIRSLVVQPEVGAEYEGVVRSILDVGAVVEILPGKDGLVHKSELSWDYVTDPKSVVQVGDKIKVIVTEIRDRGRLRLSHKATLPRPANLPKRPRRPPRGRGGRSPRRDGSRPPRRDGWRPSHRDGSRPPRPHRSRKPGK